MTSVVSSIRLYSGLLHILGLVQLYIKINTSVLLPGSVRFLEIDPNVWTGDHVL